MAISMPMLVLTALKTEKTTKRLNEMMYIVRRPSFSEKDDLADVNSCLFPVFRGGLSQALTTRVGRWT